MNNDADKKEDLQEIKARIEKLIRAIIKEVVEEENDKDQYCAWMSFTAVFLWEARQFD